MVRRLYPHDRCYIFQNRDGRVIFAIPYENDFTLIGTTDRDYAGDPAAVTISEDEKNYLCAAASEYFRAPSPATRSCGVIPACARCSMTALPRRRKPPANMSSNSMPDRRLAECRRRQDHHLSPSCGRRARKLAPYLKAPRPRKIDRKSPLPGGDLNGLAVAELTAQPQRRSPFLETANQTARARLRHARSKVLGRRSARDLDTDSARPDEAEIRLSDLVGIGMHLGRRHMAKVRFGLRLTSSRSRLSMPGFLQSFGSDAIRTEAVRLDDFSLNKGTFGFTSSRLRGEGAGHSAAAADSSTG